MGGAEPRPVVIGAGVGGLLAAAHLARAGRRPLVIEAGDRLGGRFSTLEVDGYRLPTGAIAIVCGGSFMGALDDLGIAYDLRFPDPPAHVRIRGRTVAAGAPAWGFLVNKVARSAAAVAEGIRGDEADDDLTIGAWTRRRSRSATVRTLVETLSRTIWTVGADELPARLFLANLRREGGYKGFGLAPRGNREIAEAIGADVTAHGGEVRTGWRATAIEVEGERAAGVVAQGPARAPERIEADAVVSNAGPAATDGLLPEGAGSGAFADRARRVRATSMLALSFSADRELMPGCPGILNFTDTERLSSVVNLTATCPDLAPPGRHLYEAYGVPVPSMGGTFDEEAERRLLASDLHRAFDGYAEHAETVHLKVMRGASPAMRAGPGTSVSVHTPLANLVEVGDGVRPELSTGTNAAAESAMEAAALLARKP